MKDISVAERPREKMFEKGVSALGTAELLAVLLRNGDREGSALDLAQRILSSAEGSLTGLASLSADRLCSLPGVGECKAASVLAAIELGRRFMAEASHSMRKPVVSARDVYDIMAPLLKGRICEECWALFLNAHNCLISKQRMTSGGAGETVIDVRQIVRIALEKNALGIILVHNHPSGDPKPSPPDIKQTVALRKAADSCSIALMDHVIMSDGCYFSFADEKVEFPKP